MTTRAGKNARQPLMAGNWKMNNNHLEAIALTQRLAFTLSDEDFNRVEVVILLFTDLRSVQTMVDGDDLRLGYGAQDLSTDDLGAFTGDISGLMLAKLGCSYVVVGHSERRQYHGEDDALVRDKVAAAFRHDLTPILCIGEDLAVRETGNHVGHCLAQLTAALEGLGSDRAQRIVVAYEPVWAIGTGKVATPADAQEVCGAVRARLGELYESDLAAGIRVLYGGSVKASNAAAIMAERDVDGALIGGASLDPEEFVGIVRYHRERTEESS